MLTVNDAQLTTQPQAWIEIDLRQFQLNLDLIWADKPPQLAVAAVIKDNAYGHGAVPLARLFERQGAAFLVVASVTEAIELRQAGLSLPILLLGERHLSEFDACLEFNLTPSIGDKPTLDAFEAFLRAQNRSLPIHLKLNTGMNRYGFRWSEAPAALEKIRSSRNLQLQGIMSHFSMSDELDKSYALLQLSRFNELLDRALKIGLRPRFAHLCNSGGFLDLPQAHFDMVRLGILPLGIFPSTVCRRIEGIAPIMNVKARVASIRFLEEGDKVGYGLRFTAPGPMRIAVLPIGYGAGFPRVRNQGHVLLHGRRAPIIGGVAMDALTVDITDIPETKPWDVATLMGRDGAEEITVHDLAKLKNSVSYDVLVSWQSRLPRLCLE